MPTSASLKELVKDPENESPATNPLYNKDEVFNNLYYVGASTTPGTGLPMVIISSRLVTERIEVDHASAV